MKHVKHLLVAALTVFLAVVLAVPAFADDGYTITLKSGDTHTYNVYQVLTGDVAADGKTLSNAEWGSSAIASPGTIDDFVADISASGLSEAQIAAKVAAKVDASKEVGTVSDGQPFTTQKAGYYILIDQTDLTSADFKNDTKSIHVVQVVQTTTLVNLKYDTTSDDKVITADTLGEDGNKYNPGTKTDNVSIGDTVTYQITAKVPAKASDYNYFYFIINDTLDTGLTFTKNSIKVYKNSVDETNLLTAKVDDDNLNDYQVKYNVNGHTFEVALNDAKSLAGSDIIVTYSAVLNENANIGETPNKNTSTVTFSNDPHHDYDGNTYPGFPADKDKNVLGETPVTETKTYTTGIEILKVDENGNKLTGATFEISGTSVKTIVTKTETFTADDNGEYYLLKNGTYTKEAPSTEQTMEQAAEGATEGYVVDNSHTGEDKVVIGETTYRPYAPAIDTDATVYVLVNGNADKYESTTQKYAKTVTNGAKLVSEDQKVSAAVDENGIVRFDGLGAGTYTIKEIVTPDGYNTMADKTITISFNGSSTSNKWSTTSEEAGYDAKEGVFKYTIKNNKGSELPETGGMGTTILYVVGGCMVAAGVVMFLTKRRMASLEK